MTSPNYNGYTDTKEQARARIEQRESRWLKEQIDEAAAISFETFCRDLTYDEIDALFVALECTKCPAHIRTGSEVSELQRDAEWLGTRTTISGGEVLELDTYLESRDDDSVDEIPF